MVERTLITQCYCCKCRELKTICEYTSIHDGDLLPVVNVLSYVWNKFIIDNREYYVCPDHKLKINIFIDGEEYTLKREGSDE